ncbi:MAG: hypothetical protein CMF62_00775 [Magnetococcales bacterium]|nr:hypothetical protein [Magnetococcales bacterium]|tara:strand:+ start:7312 stop:9003 length:1692 start_codon:yes stop_codon:yes gene_type:complete
MRNIQKVLNYLKNELKIRRINEDYLSLDDIGTNAIKSKSILKFRHYYTNKTKIENEYAIKNEEGINIILNSRKNHIKDVKATILNIINEPSDMPEEEEKDNLTFKFGDEKLKFIKYNDDIWVKGKEIATILEYENTRKAIRDHVDKEDKIQNPTGGEQNVPPKKDNKNYSESIFINEYGIYSLIMNSKMKKAKEFKKWVYKEVLPSIRKTGSYNIIDKPEDKVPELLIKNVNSGEAYVYLFDLYNDCSYYKYGVSSNLTQRLKRHRRTYPKMKVIGVYECDNRSYADEIERKIKWFCQANKIAKKHKKQVEIFTPNENITIELIINKIKEFQEKYGKKAIQTENKEDLKKYIFDIVKEAINKEKQCLDKKVNDIDENIKNDDVLMQKMHCPLCKSIKYPHKVFCDTCEKKNKYKALIDSQQLPPYKILKKRLSTSNYIKVSKQHKMTIEEFKTTMKDLKDLQLITYEPKITEKVDDNYTKPPSKQKTKECPMCHEPMTKKSSVCCKCWHKNEFLKNKNNRPKYSTLKEKLTTQTYVQTGKDYNVTDNTIRKWIKQYEKYNILD